MPKQIIIAEQHRIAAVFSEDQIQELIVAKGTHQVSDIYLGIVENVLPGIDAAFVNIGDPDRNGFIHVTDLGPLRLKRSAGAITELLVPQQKVLVQIMKEPTGNKGPRLTGNISLPGRYLVLMPFGRGVNLSRRIRNENERSRLRALGILIKPAGMGLLMRTEAEGVSEEAIIEDLTVLQKQWELIQQQATSTRAPALLNRDDDFIQRVLRDVFSADVNRIVVDSHTGVKRVKQHLMTWNANRLPQGVLIDQHRESAPILEYFRVNAAIREALKPRVDLPSGGYIIIERTEALTVIDVNSGSFTRSATARETVLWTNCEAATEIARQLRLRNMAGVIIVDFIDMDSRRDQLQVLEHFNKALKADKARPQIAQLSELGLVELTRKRQGQNIYELFGRTCPTCGGLGHLVHLPGEPENAMGEMVERYISPRVQEFPTLVEARSPELVDGRSDEFDFNGTDETQDGELAAQPNYQDRSSLSGSRRRRRQRLPDPLPSKSSPVAKVPAPTLSGTSALPSGTPPVILSGTNGYGQGVEKPEPSDRPKPLRQEPSRRDEPPEVISVVMTAEEQDVYATMGISPLVFYKGEVKDPKSVVVSVTLPGQTPTPPPPPILRRSELRQVEPIEAPTPSSMPESEVSEVPEVAEPDIAESVPVATLAPEVSEPEAEANENGPAVARRRRRRSSAAMGRQLSLETENFSED